MISRRRLRPALASGAALCLFLVALYPGLAWTQAADPAPEQPPPDPAVPATPDEVLDEVMDEGVEQTPYTVDLVGVEDDALAQALRDGSSLFRLREEPPPSAVGLRRRAARDRDQFQTILRSFGHYDGRLTVDIDTEVSPARVQIKVEPGPVYTLSTIEVVGEEAGPAPPEPAIAPAEIGLTTGAPGRAETIVEAGRTLLSIMGQRGYPYADLARRRVVVNHADQTMAVTYVVKPGPEVRLGPVQFSGLERVEESVARNRVPWEAGTEYSPERLQQLQDNLVGLEVFSTVRVRLPDVSEVPVGDGNRATVPVQVDLVERPRRFIGFGASFSTEDGLAANGYWGHRNLLGGAERFRVGLEVGGVGRQNSNTSGSGVDQFDYSLTTLFSKPDFISLGQSLDLTAEAVRENPEAFQRTALAVTGVVTRPLAAGLVGSLGLTFEQSRIDEGEQTTDSTLVGVPGALTFDRTDDLLDPTKGFRLSLAATPYLSVAGETGNFSVFRFGGSTYYDVTGDTGFVLAGRAVFGTILGSSLFNIPADKRFYAGGGGSVRGFGFQQVGPRGADDDPTGGKSLIELGIEGRIKITETIGLVPFVDAGQVFDETLPDFSRSLKVGAGLGVRYYTSFGPLRVDVAVPVNKEDDDNAFQLYVSIGQAF